MLAYKLLLKILIWIWKDINFYFLFSLKKQSIANADKREEEYFKRQSDIIFVLKHRKYIYELIYTECFCLVCTKHKKRNNSVKLWKEVNNRIFWICKGCYSNKDKFRIIKIQVADIFFFLYYTFYHIIISYIKIGYKLYLNILIRDLDDIY